MKSSQIAALFLIAWFASATAHSATNYETRLAELSAEIRAREQRANKLQNVANAYDLAAKAYLERAQLTGDYDDYLMAQENIARAFALLDDKSGPYFTRAKLRFALHELDKAEQDLDKLAQRPLLNPEMQAAMYDLRTDIAYQRGDYKNAAAGANAALERTRDAGNLFRRARLYADETEFEQAEKLLGEAIASAAGDDAHLEAWLCLQRGLLDLERGRWDDALVWYQRGQRVFPGWWLIDEHVVEILSLQGHDDRAKPLYESIIARTGHPEFMDALAALYEQRGDSAKAAEWVAKARKEHESRIAKIPAAASGHALDHFLDYEADAARVVAMARENYERRPNPRAALQLAQALAKAGDDEAAEKILETAMQSPYRSADLLAFASDLASRRNDPAAAAKHRAAALAINPFALDEQ
ncbi:MAG: tetratricopeptide repeat protein [Phycisphaerae bacterium]